MISSRPLEPADASAPTLRELGEAIGVDAASLAAAVAEFDKHAELGEDPGGDVRVCGGAVAGWRTGRLGGWDHGPFGRKDRDGEIHGRH